MEGAAAGSWQLRAPAARLPELPLRAALPQPDLHMMCRNWHGYAHPQNAAAYERLQDDEISTGIAQRGIPGFRARSLKRITAATTYDKAASIAVMRKLGMEIHRNPYSEPAWMQLVATLESSIA